MNWFDLVVVIFVAVCMIRGFMRGLARELSSLVGLILTAWISFRLFPMVTPLTKYVTDNTTIQTIFSFLLVFIIVWLFFMLLGYLIQRTLRLFSLTSVDRFLGGLAGTIKGFLLALILFSFLMVFLPIGSITLSASKTAPYLVTGSQFIRSLMPTSVSTTFDNHLNQLKTLWGGGDEALSQILRENERVSKAKSMRR